MHVSGCVVSLFSLMLPFPHQLVCCCAAGNWMCVLTAAWECVKKKKKQRQHRWCSPEPFGSLGQWTGHALLLDLRAAGSESCSCHFSDRGLYHMFRSQVLWSEPTEACIWQCVLSSNCGISDKSHRFHWKSVVIFLFPVDLFSDLSSPNLPSSHPRMKSVLVTGQLQHPCWFHSVFT